MNTGMIKAKNKSVEVFQAIKDMFSFAFSGRYRVLTVCSLHFLLILLLKLITSYAHGSGTISFATILLSLLAFVCSIFLWVLSIDLFMNLLRVALLGPEYAMPMYSSPESYSKKQRGYVSSFFWKFLGKNFLISMVCSVVIGLFLSLLYLVVGEKGILRAFTNPSDSFFVWLIFIGILLFGMALLFKLQLSLAATAIGAPKRDIFGLFSGTQSEGTPVFIKLVLLFAVLIVGASVVAIPLVLVLQGLGGLALLQTPFIGALLSAVYLCLSNILVAGLLASIYRQIAPEVKDYILEAAG